MVLQHLSTVKSQSRQPRSQKPEERILFNKNCPEPPRTGQTFRYLFPPPMLTQTSPQFLRGKKPAAGCPRVLVPPQLPLPRNILHPQSPQVSARAPLVNHPKPSPPVSRKHRVATRVAFGLTGIGNAIRMHKRQILHLRWW